MLESDLPSAVGEENLTHCLELRDLKGRVGEGAGNGNKGERKGGHQGEEIVHGGEGGSDVAVRGNGKSQRADLIKQRADAAAAF
ncbi:unnamed protein product [Closterium sp. NIES-65]|nr:unnamed protein product [Closterium sp. NIES-65]